MDLPLSSSSSTSTKTSSSPSLSKEEKDIAGTGACQRSSMLGSGCPRDTVPSCSGGSGNVQPETAAAAAAANSDLGQRRERSSILRAGENVADGETWVYPSEKMFFEAMRRKNWDPKAEDMKVVVPIHNAVNERAWRSILEWESFSGKGKQCVPKLRRFEGRSDKLSLRARLLTSVLGYTAPFDRHDWTVDRCGQEITYVIDFYTGSQVPKSAGQMLSFYLDTRPRLDSWIGCKLRVTRFFAELVGWR